MRRDYHNWFSSRLDRHMELLSYGHAGTPLLVFPTSRARFFEYEDSGMIHALAPKIEAGRLYVFCVDSVDTESWHNRSIHPHDRVMRQIAYENYLLFEVVPFMKGTSGAAQIWTTGCSLGGYQALNFAMRHPDVTSACVAMSGSFDMKRFMDGYYDQDFYYNNPVDYLPNMNDPWFLDRYKTMAVKFF
jgi:esterase/lipase superfamily enzyme